MITVRRADSADLEWLAEQLQAFAAFFDTKLSLFPSDPIQMQIQLLDMMLPERGCFFVAERTVPLTPIREGSSIKHGVLPRRVGFIAAWLHPHPYNYAITQLTETFWWVAPEHRGSSAAGRLLAAFEEYGREHADWIVMSLEAKSPINPLTLARRGFRLQESSYLLEVSHA